MHDTRRSSAALAEGPPEPEYAEILDRLRRTVIRICPSWLADSRDDLVQAAVIKVMEIARGREQSVDFSSSYLWRVVHSVLIDEIRRARRRNEIGLEGAGDPEDKDAALMSRPTNPLRLLAAKELGRELWDCLGRLVEARRRVVTLHLEGLSPAEAAVLLGFETKKVYNLIHRGMHDLRDCLRSKELAP